MANIARIVKVKKYSIVFGNCAGQVAISVDKVAIKRLTIGWVFGKILPEAKEFDLADVLCVSDFGWAHYYRHRYKMPPEILITDELSSMTEDLLEDI